MSCTAFINSVDDIVQYIYTDYRICCQKLILKLSYFEVTNCLLALRSCTGCTFCSLIICMIVQLINLVYNQGAQESVFSQPCGQLLSLVLHATENKWLRVFTHWH